ncbi:hypothetical protein A6E01_20335 (plasmid) [Vibrio breoganii]|uniref:Uncharacterized protein n=1 Tax=Vibrio breoganii TaxID=553239 RepID=A0AAN0XZR2_9VIBR|nr:hypothetical protein [Vibrio breoganii]ANO35563.1 hypothetical protein A6E01_20335 [Vibrio breoganii]PML15826.1 hypothetical protein BCT84_07430 [Vibrio breoganii]
MKKAYKTYILFISAFAILIISYQLKPTTVFQKLPEGIALSATSIVELTPISNDLTLYGLLLASDESENIIALSIGKTNLKPQFSAESTAAAVLLTFSGNMGDIEVTPRSIAYLKERASVKALSEKLYSEISMNNAYLHGSSIYLEPVFLRAYLDASHLSTN